MEIPCAVVPNAVDEDGRRATDAVTPAVGDIFEHALPHGLVADVLLELVHVEAQRAHKVEQLCLRDRRLAVVEPAVHLPEPSLSRRRLCNTGRELRARMRALVWEMSEDILKPRTQHAA
jgi:hypothetical protein